MPCTSPLSTQPRLSLPCDLLRCRLDWPALAEHPFITNGDVLAPVVYMQGAVEYSQLPPAAQPPAAADVASKSSKSAGHVKSSVTSAPPQPTARAAEGRALPHVDVLQFGGGEGLDVSLPLSDVVRADHEMW